MSSGPPNISLNGKTGNTNTSSHSAPQQQQQQQQPPHSQSPNFESHRRRSAAHSGQSPRNSQGQRKQHKNQRRPKLVDEDAMAESRVIRNSNGRRGQTSITHLMNFSLPPRPQYNARLPRRNVTYGLGSGHHAIDKARYVHANYRFIVKPKGEYRDQAVDADIHLEWDNVLQILASTESQASSCPICLSPPVAPRMARCGHIFCLPCLLRYMHSTDDTGPVPEKKARWKKCPICWDAIYVSDTRPVRWYTGQEGPAPREGDDVVLRLIMRQPGSTLALPRDGAEIPSKAEDVPWYFAAEVTDYARVMKGSEEYMASQFDREIEELQMQEKEDELMFGEDTEWTRKAVGNILNAKERIVGIGDPPPLPKPKQSTEKKVKKQPIVFNTATEDVPDMYLHQHAVKSGYSISDKMHALASSSDNGVDVSKKDIAQTNTTATKLETIKLDDVPNSAKPMFNRHRTDGHPPDSPYFFYQALLHYYLAPLDIRILKASFGDFASFPSTLLPRVERVSTGHVVDDELRKRTKYLSHLPYGCEVGFLECDWTDVVAPEVLANFREEVERRRRRNREKESREEKDRVRAEKEEDDKRWAAARRKRPTTSILQTDETLPSWTADFQPLGEGAGGASSLPRSGDSSTAFASNNFSSASPPWASSSSSRINSRPRSTFASLASPGTSPAGRTVWGTSMVMTPASPEMRPQTADGDAGADDGWLHDWEQEIRAENEALIAQVEAASLGAGDESSAAAAGAVGPAAAATNGTVPAAAGGGKKKKAKKITLMSTTARRAA